MQDTLSFSIAFHKTYHFSEYIFQSFLLEHFMIGISKVDLLIAPVISIFKCHPRVKHTINCINVKASYFAYYA